MGGVLGTASFEGGSADGEVLEIGRDVSATTARAGGTVCFGASALKADDAAACTGLSMGVATAGTGSAAGIVGEPGSGAACAGSRASGTGPTVFADSVRFGFATGNELSRSSVEDAMNLGVPTEVDVAGGVPGTAGFGTGSADGRGLGIGRDVSATTGAGGSGRCGLGAVCFGVSALKTDDAAGCTGFSMGVATVGTGLAVGRGLGIGRDVSATTARADGPGRCGLGAVCFGASASRAGDASARVDLSVGVAGGGTGSGARILGVTSPGAAWVRSRSIGTGVSILADWARLGFETGGDGGSGAPASTHLSRSGVEETANPGVPAEVGVAGKSAGSLGAVAGCGTEEGGGALDGALAESAADRLPRGAGPGGGVRVGALVRTGAAGPARMRLMSAPGFSKGPFAR